MAAVPGSFPSAEEWRTIGAPASAPGDAFDLSGITAPTPVHPQAPIIAEWNRTAIKPDESFTLTGARFTKRSGARAGSDVTVWLYARDAGLRKCRIWQVDSNSLMAAVPEGIAFGMYLVWVENEAGVSAPVALNRPDGQWLGPMGNMAAPGDVKCVYGKNLSRNHDTLTSFVSIDGVSAEIVRVEPYSVAFRVPLSISNGNHTVWIHSGHGGAYGWGGPVTLRVEQPWQRGPDVAAASPSGGDDCPAIQAAIDQMGALADGGTVQLQKGTYYLRSSIGWPGSGWTCWLLLKSKVRIRGMGMDSTIVYIDSPLQTSHGIAVQADDVAFEDFTLRYRRNSIGPTYGYIYPHYQIMNTGNRFVRLRVDADSGSVFPANGGNPVVDLSGNRSEISGCEFDFSVHIRGSVWIHDNTFHGGPSYFAEGCLEGTGQNAVIERNHFATKNWPDNGGNRNYEDYMTSDEINFGRIWAKRIFSTMAGNDNLYIGHNTSSDVAVQDNKGEMILFHGLASGWYAQVASNSGRILSIRTDGLIDGHTLSVTPDGHTSAATPAQAVPDGIYWNWPIDNLAYVMIEGGTGMGQSRIIVSHTTTTITVNRDWRVAPDATSKIVIGYMNNNVAIYRNVFNAFPEGYRHSYSASCAVSMDGNVLNSVIDNNESYRTYGTISVCGSPTGPGWWNEVRDHTGHSAYAGGIRFVQWAWGPTGSMGPWLLGNRAVHNTVSVSAVAPGVPTFHESPLSTIMPATSGVTGELTSSCMFEHNIGTGGKTEFSAGDWANVLFRGNTTSGANTAGALFAQTARPVLIENQHVGSLSQTGGKAIPLPLFRAAQFALTPSQTADSTTIPIANGGVLDMTWSASTNDSWIDASVDSGASVSAEKCSGLLKIRVTKPAGFSAPTWGLIKLATQAGDSTFIGVLVEQRAPASGGTKATTNASGAWARIMQSPDGEVILHFRLCSPGNVTFELFDVQGKRIWHGESNQQKAGVPAAVTSPRMLRSGFCIAQVKIGNTLLESARIVIRKQ